MVGFEAKRRAHEWVSFLEGGCSVIFYSISAVLLTSQYPFNFMIELLTNL